MLATRLTTARSLARLVPSGRRSLASGHGSHGTPAPIVNMPKAPSSMPAGYPRPPPASTDLGQTAWAVGGVLGVVGVGAALALGGGGDKHGHGDAKAAAHSAPAAAATAAHGVDYNAVAKDVAALLEKDSDYDGIGHYGPLLVRLAWHASGTYDVKSKTGGSNGATMRFEPESKWGANAGLAIARDLLEPVKQKYGDKLSYADLWTLAGVVAIKEMGGPSVPWRAGRSDEKDGSKIVPDGRLPDATQGSDHLRNIFYRMGFNDQEIVALSGAHALGKCHTDRSGFKGPWTFSPTSFTNAYFTLLLSEKWVPKKTDEGPGGKPVAWKGPAQFTDEKTKTLMMLPTDLVLIKDAEFKKSVDKYAADQDAFFKDFSAVFARLLELGSEERLAASKPYHF